MPSKDELRRLKADFAEKSPVVKSTRLRHRSHKGGRAIVAKNAKFLQKLKKLYSHDPKVFQMNAKVVLYRDPRGPNKIPFCYEENEPARSTKLVVHSKPQHHSVRTMSICLWLMCIMMMIDSCY